MKKLIVFFTILSFIFLYVAEQALACKGTEVIFEDNFATLDPAWGQSSTNLSINNGKMVIKPDVAYHTLNQSFLLEDIDACVKLTLASANAPGNAIGAIMFWAKDYSDYFLLEIDGNGSFTVAHLVKDRWLYPVTWRENPAINKGVGQTNQLRVVTKGNQATIYINDKEAVSFKGQPPQGGGLIGLYGASLENAQAVWEFSELKITKPM